MSLALCLDQAARSNLDKEEQAALTGLDHNTKKYSLLEKKRR